MADERQRGRRPGGQRAGGGRPTAGGGGHRSGRDDRDGGMPLRPAQKPRPRRPELPEERPFLPRDAWRDLRATVPQNAVDDVIKAVGAAGDAVHAGDPARAVELLTWAKSVAPRSATVRESLGLALYSAERFGEAQSELLTYRRLSGAADQNHLLADCARALGKADKMVALVDEMIAARVDPARIAEGVMVIAGERADRGDLDGALDTLRRLDLDPDQVQPWHARVWYLAGDLSERLGEADEAREYFQAVIALDDEFADAAERLAALEAPSGPGAGG